MLGHSYRVFFYQHQHVQISYKFSRILPNYLQIRFESYRSMSSSSGKTDSNYDYDYFVIGGGSGGVRSSRIAAQFGARVALAEEKKLGILILKISISLLYISLPRRYMC